VTAAGSGGYKPPSAVLFNTLDYAKFFGIVFVVAWLLGQWPRWRLLFLLGASYVFYAHWDLRFLLLIFGSSSLDYWLGAQIGAADDPALRKRWLWLTVIVNLGALATFKYLNFGIHSAQLALSELGFHVQLSTLELALPVGISFFTFESMSYVIDVYRRELPPHKSYLEYLTFVAFFPHLVAGPIVRPRDLLPQLAAKPVWNADDGGRALYLISWGLLKKVAIADTLGLNLVDRVFDAPAQYSSLECYSAIVGYAVQIYCDFSGYTDIAIGSALLLGIKFPLNFDSPYKATDIQDFWRRWHISLSTWLRDYLYVPLGGNRGSRTRTLVNLMLTMLLGGLWHGANWTFVAWGGLHGAALVLQRLVFGRSRNERGLIGKVIGVFVTFHFVCLAWVFFRATSFRAAWAVLGQVAQLTTYHPNLHPRILAVLAVGLVTHWLPERWYQLSVRRFCALPALGQGLLLIAVAMILREMASAEAVPFVYFQF
jgi:alginate O-acetyltransferase complex protein AlgI